MVSVEAHNALELFKSQYPSCAIVVFNEAPGGHPGLLLTRALGLLVTTTLRLSGQQDQKENLPGWN